jgi:hypothetical protein
MFIALDVCMHAFANAHNVKASSHTQTFRISSPQESIIKEVCELQIHMCTRSGRARTHGLKPVAQHVCHKPDGNDENDENDEKRRNRLNRRLVAIK